jgi:hypothetical protein
VADVVISVDDLEAAFGERAGILHSNQDAVEDSAGRECPPAKIIALAATGQKNGYKTG